MAGKDEKRALVLLAVGVVLAVVLVFDAGYHLPTDAIRVVLIVGCLVCGGDLLLRARRASTRSKDRDHDGEH